MKIHLSTRKLAKAWYELHIIIKSATFARKSGIQANRGHSSLFYFINTLSNMDLKKLVWECTEGFLPDESIFVVDVKVSSKNASHIRVILDGDQGVSIDQCASISRQLGHYLEENDVMDHAYNLEVSSPGVDYPLQHLRQYQSRVGRKLELSLTEGEVIKGKLLEITEGQLRIAKEKKVKKKVEIEEVSVAFEEIKEAKVLVSFN
ncbi:MAG: ribosome maturation factor RimP [Flammeovirgaceae bacterium]